MDPKIVERTSYLKSGDNTLSCPADGLTYAIIICSVLLVLTIVGWIIVIVYFWLKKQPQSRKQMPTGMTMRRSNASLDSSDKRKNEIATKTPDQSPAKIAVPKIVETKPAKEESLDLRSNLADHPPVPVSTPPNQQNLDPAATPTVPMPVSTPPNQQKVEAFFEPPAASPI